MMLSFYGCILSAPDFALSELFNNSSFATDSDTCLSSSTTDFTEVNCFLLKRAAKL